MLGMDGRLSLEADGASNAGECLERTATGWKRQVAAGGRVDAIATLDCLDGEEQVGALLVRGNIVEALAGAALAVPERVSCDAVTGRLVPWAAGDEIVGSVESAAAADGDTFNLMCGAGSTPTTV